MKSIIISLLFLALCTVIGCSSSPSSPEPKKAEIISVYADSPTPEKKMVFGPLHHRFYQGYRLTSVGPKQFEEIINVKFLPLFTEAEPYGLYTYRPTLLVETEGCTLPAEIALLTFKNEQVYGRYRDTEIGKKIRDAHGLVFDFKTSSSLVPENYQKKVEYDHAYNLRKNFKDYRDSHSALLVYCEPKTAKKTLIQLEKAYSSKSKARNIIFSVNSDHLAEYIFARNEADLEVLITERKKKFSSIYKNTAVIKLDKEKIGTMRVKPGQGLDAQW
jgi:hypothetical protein